MVDQRWREIIEGGFQSMALPDVHIDCRSLDPGVSSYRFRSSDIADAAWLVEGKGDGPPWIAILRLNDGRWVFFSYTQQITGDLYWTYIFAADRGRLWWWACGDDDRERLSAVFSDDDYADELVQLDIMLQSEDDQIRRMGETRMSRIRRR